MNEHDLLKIKAVLLYIVGRFHKEVDYIKVFKLLYLAQKKHIETYGLPIIKDDFIAFKAGPAPSKTYEICRIANNDFFNPALDNYASAIEVITKSRQDKTIKYIKAKESPDLKQLSKSNIKILDAIFDKYNSYTSSRLSTLSHDAAWRKKWDETAEFPNKITLNDILSTLNIPEEMKNFIRNSAMLNGIKID